jgi:hypothetical protein
LKEQEERRGRRRGRRRGVMPGGEEKRGRG